MNNKRLLLLLSVTLLSLVSISNAYAVTVYPGTVIQNNNPNPYTKYIADVHPNFNVTSITVNNNHIFLGVPSYDFYWIGNTVNANITKFVENHNATFFITNTPVNPKIDVLGKLQAVSLDGNIQAYGSTWSYTFSGTYTEINPGTHKTIYVSWDGGPIVTSGFIIKGYTLSSASVYSNQNITL